MTLRPILIHPDPRLKARTADIAEVTDTLRALADDMLETMYDAPGIGLAAPQIGVMQRMLVMDCVKKEDAGWKSGNKTPLVCINPVILDTSKKQVSQDEGCLSIPGPLAKIMRPRAVTVRYLNERGESEDRDLVGLWATSVQHQIDHLNGKLYFDHLSKMKRDMLLRKARKQG
ncbi:UNVERIFIED_CONTAM: hypothetical protein GTU68_018466 [Idotea baltica]|nr:hypothetical protein [Idotea baltica]